jgi:hypothetical protein
VFDLLPNSIEDWVDSSDVLRTGAAVFSVPVAPYLGGALGGLVLGGLSAAGVWLALRPDRRPIAENGLGPWTVAGLAMVGAVWPAALGLGSWVAPTLGLPSATSGYGLAVVALLALLGGAGLTALLALTRLPAGVLLAVAAVVGWLGWSWQSLGVFFSTPEVLSGMVARGERINPEWMLNVNAGMIVFTMVFFAWLSGFVRPLTSILLGMIVATVGALAAGVFVAGWVCIAGIAIFSIGEMLSSPKKLEYLAGLSGKGQEGLYMGYANVPVALGWIFGSLFAGNRYEAIGDKVNLARAHLVNQVGLPPEEVAALDEAVVVQVLAERTGSTELAVQNLLFDLYDPWWVWVEIAGIGLISVVGMLGYDLALRAIDRRKAAT